MPNNIIYTKIDNLSLSDYNVLYASSAAALDVNAMYVGISDEKKKDAIYNAILDTFAKDKSFGYRADVNGQIAAFAVGVIQEKDLFVGKFFLTATIDNNRNWLHTDENKLALIDFFTQQGLARYEIYTYVGSTLYKMYKNRAAAGKINIYDEWLTGHKYNDFDIVILRIMDQ